MLLTLLIPTIFYDGMLQPQLLANEASFRQRSEHAEKFMLLGADGQLCRLSV